MRLSLPFMHVTSPVEIPEQIQNRQVPCFSGQKSVPFQKQLGTRAVKSGEGKHPNKVELQRQECIDGLLHNLLMERFSSANRCHADLLRRLERYAQCITGTLCLLESLSRFVLT